MKEAKKAAVTGPDYRYLDLWSSYNEDVDRTAHYNSLRNGTSISQPKHGSAEGEKE